MKALIMSIQPASNSRRPALITFLALRTIWLLDSGE
jgi:hypothetical protein